MVWVVVALLEVTSLLCMYIGFVRNGKVFRYRGKLIKQISAASIEDIERGRPWMWRFDMFETVSYDRVMITFWRPIQSFYTDTRMIDPEAVEP